MNSNLERESEGKIMTWIRGNLWNILLTLVFLAIAYARHDMKILALENTVNTYPSQDYFELQFSTIYTQIGELKEDIKNIKQK